MEIDVAGTLDYQPYEFSLAELRDKALASRPDLKAAQLSERAADASIRLQDAQRIPDLTLGTGIDQVPLGTSTYTFGVGIALPVSNRNQGERAGHIASIALADRRQYEPARRALEKAASDEAFQVGDLMTHRRGGQIGWPYGDAGFGLVHRDCSWRACRVAGSARSLRLTALP